MTAITTEEYAIYDEISRLGALLWDASLNVLGLNDAPKMFSIMLFKRLWSNHRGYTLLHNNAFSLEADIILRSGLEAAICIAANFRLREEFVLLMRRDAAYTLQGQVKVHRENGTLDLVKDCEARLRQLHAGIPEGVKAARLDWNTLAQKGQVPQLYGFHRMLSGVSSHVTGMSVLMGVVGADGEGAEAQNEIRNRSSKNHLIMMAGATLQGAMLHAGMIGEDKLVRTAKGLVDQLNIVTTAWTETPRHKT